MYRNVTILPDNLKLCVEIPGDQILKPGQLFIINISDGRVPIFIVVTPKSDITIESANIEFEKVSAKRLTVLPVSP